MLDRKTKNIDASIELLEDKKNNIKQMKNILMFTGFLLVTIGLMGGFIVGLLEMSYFKGASFALISLVAALLVVILCFPLVRDSQYLDLLIYLKRQFEKEKKHG